MMENTEKEISADNLIKKDIKKEEKIDSYLSELDNKKKSIKEFFLWWIKDDFNKLFILI